MFRTAFDALHRWKLYWESFPVRRYARIEGFLSRVEALALYRFASSLPPSAVCCEIGSWKGKSTYCLALGILKRKNGSKLIAIDPFDAAGDPDSAERYRQQQGMTPLLEQFVINMEKLRVIDVVEIHPGCSAQHAASVPALDLLFIDGDHSVEGCTSDYDLYAGKIKPGGYLLLHDYHSSRKELGPVHVIETKVLPSLEYEFLGTFDSLWVARKLPGVSASVRA
jgi:predicted O-methyltransferase YrrM